MGPRRSRGEEGVFLVLWALLIVGIMTMVAIVLDLSALRADRRNQRAAADAGAAAGAFELGTTPARACSAALGYAARNLDLDPASFTTPSGGCGTWTGCTTATPRSVTYTYRDWTITVANPVLTGDPLLLADAVGPDLAQGTSTDADGFACERVGVRINYTREPIFARVIGNRENTTSAHSVARLGPGGPAEEPASLVLLERLDCRAVWTQGVDTRLVVASAPGSGTNPPAAGIIQADSDGSGNCPGAGAKIVEGFAGSSGPSILAEHARNGAGVVVKRARIGVFGLLTGSSKTHTAWPGTVGEPEPEGFKQVGRTPADQRFLENVRALETAATAVVDSTTLPAGFVNATDPVPTGLGLTCDIDTVTPITTAQGSRLWFNCPGGLLVRNLTIESADAEVVVAGPLRITSTGFTVRDARKLWIRGTTTGNQRGLDIAAPFTVNNDTLGTCSDRFLADRTRIGTLFLKEGQVITSSTTIQLCQTFVYLRGANSPTAASFLPGAVTPPPALPPAPADNASLGSINVGAGSLVDWTAPNELDVLPTDADLAIHNYEDLALWTEASAPSSLKGSGAMNLGGIYFLPNANDFEITGSSPQAIDLDAQFYVRKLKVAGNSTLRMVPNPANQIPITSGKVSLIR